MSEPCLFVLPRAHFKLTGPDRLRYLHGQVTQNLRSLTPGISLPACITDAKGKLQAEIWVSSGEECLLLDTHPELAESLALRLEKYMIADDCVLEPSSDTVLLHSLSDPAALPALASLASSSAPRLGRPGWDIRIPSSLWNSLSRDFSALLGSDAQWESLRILHGIPVWGRELTPQTLPPEAGLDRTHVDYHKGCYIGQEVLSRIKSAGRVNRKLFKWKLSAAALPEPGTPILLSAPLSQPPSEAGHITSAAQTSEGPRALGFIKTQFEHSSFVLPSGEEILPLSRA